MSQPRLSDQSESAELRAPLVTVTFAVRAHTLRMRESSESPTWCKHT